MFDWITGWVGSLGVFGIALLMLLENIILFLPSELIMPLGGFLAARGDFNFWLMLLAGFIGSLIGSLPWYIVARSIGRERTTAWLTRHGRWLGLRRREIDRADRWFDRHATGAVFLARVTPGIRPLIGLPAGFARMPWHSFVLFTALGTALWVAALAWAGRLLGRRWKQVADTARPIIWITLALLLLATLIWLARRALRHHHTP